MSDMTVTIYGLGCKSTTKAKQWMINNQIPFVERNIKKEPLTVPELQDILRLTMEGTDEIIAKRSSHYQKVEVDFDDLSLVELLEMIQKQPKFLKSPIIVDGNKLQVGYNADEIRQFLPRKTRKFQLLNWTKENLQPIEW